VARKENVKVLEGTQFPTAPPCVQAKRESEEKRKALYDIMSCMRDVRKRSDRTDQMFEPLKDTVALLQRWAARARVRVHVCV